MEFYNKNQIVNSCFGLVQIKKIDYNNKALEVKDLSSGEKFTFIKMDDVSPAKRLNAQIKVGETYLNRGGVPMDVIGYRMNGKETEFHVTNKDGVYNSGCFGNGYMVSVDGSFGNFINPRDLVFKIK